MHTPGPETLAPLLAQALAARDAARSASQQADAAAGRCDAQARQLDQYRQEFRTRWSAQFAREGTAALLQVHQGFTARLDQAIAQQQQRCDASRHQATQARARLQQCELRAASVQRLIDRRLAARHQRDARLEQKRNDEFAQRGAWFGNPNAITTD